mmetsp:Transcript_58165/g.100133  ORF Transcript_58165/g.100133 Transcript_58165/m.100133 type:complete len:145 (+) Transcript_58165:544-978(+)
MYALKARKRVAGTTITATKILLRRPKKNPGKRINAAKDNRFPTEILLAIPLRNFPDPSSSCFCDDIAVPRRCQLSGDVEGFWVRKVSPLRRNGITAWARLFTVKNAAHLDATIAKVNNMRKGSMAERLDQVKSLDGCARGSRLI